MLHFLKYEQKCSHERLLRNLLGVLVVEGGAEQVVQQQEGPPPHLCPLVTILEFSVAEKSKAADRERVNEVGSEPRPVGPWWGGGPQKGRSVPQVKLTW